MKRLLSIFLMLTLAFGSSTAFAKDKKHKKDKDDRRYEDNDRDGYGHYRRDDDDDDDHDDYRHKKYYYKNGRRYYDRDYDYNRNRVFFGLNFFRPAPVYQERVYVAPAPRRSLEANVQYELRRHGYYHGPIDGAIGRGSRNAISNYQYDRGLPVTGRIDTPLLRSLGLY